MKRWMQFVWAWSALFAGWSVGHAVAYGAEGRWGWALFHGAFLVFHVLNFRWAFKKLKELKHGSNRRTQAGGGDSDAVGTTTFPLATGGTVTFTFGASRGTEGAGEDLTPDVPVEQEDMPILAHRAARLVSSVGGPRFQSMHADRTFGVDGVARCRVADGSFFPHYVDNPAHSAPGLSCQCGWYAVPTDIKHPYLDKPHVDLLVELSGRVVEHETGYRAQHQRVIECRVPACELCGSATHAVRFVDGWSTRCSQHLPSAEATNYVTLTVLSDALGVPVTIAERTRQ